MSRSPAHLRAAAQALRAMATALTADFDGLDHHSGPATWEGPAARAHRGRAAVAAFDAHAVAVDLRGLADRLDDRADEVVLASPAAIEAAAASGGPTGG